MHCDATKTCHQRALRRDEDALRRTETRCGTTKMPCSGPRRAAKARCGRTETRCDATKTCHERALRRDGDTLRRLEDAPQRHGDAVRKRAVVPRRRPAADGDALRRRAAAPWDALALWDALRRDEDRLPIRRGREPVSSY